MRQHTFPLVEIPLLIRALDLNAQEEHEFWLFIPGGEFVKASARLAGEESIHINGREICTKRIEVWFERRIYFPGATLGFVAPKETYWRVEAPHRPIARVESGQFEVGEGTGQYIIELIEEFRSPWWEEDISARIETIKAKISFDSSGARGGTN